MAPLRPIRHAFTASAIGIASNPTVYEGLPDIVIGAPVAPITSRSRPALRSRSRWPECRGSNGP